ncbi:DUF2213 domain-containing protein [Sphingomonas xinjiangensis]|uniref:Uncharacterized protein n=1 Tax=Sphingomonas xinjiangensis TaxID=643568 RepID=A0A840YL95_9SPHN|nr:hypothetical protein [Sphingomonas xinjiangensis]MBB5712078.1 hypothetical protein [Sphingomonas xinjiangensis]
MMLMDAAAVGKAESSNRYGYGCQLEFGALTAADGTKCAARDTPIIGIHIALVEIVLQGLASPNGGPGQILLTLIDVSTPAEVRVVDHW